MPEWAALQEKGLCTKGVAQRSERGSFARGDFTPVQYCLFRKEGLCHHVVLLTGWDESFIKYGEVIADLMANGFNVYTMDWRSQGLSGRLVSDPQVTYVESFTDYLEDLTFFLTSVVCKGCNVDPSNLTTIAHSMGGLLALSAAAQRPEVFSRLVVCSPMLRMKAGMPHSIVRVLGSVLCCLGLGDVYAPGQAGVDVNSPIKRKLTTDRERLREWENIRKAFPLVAMGGMSNRWVVEAVRAQDWFKNPANSSKVTLPVLLLEADDDEFVCTSKPFSELCEVAPDCRRIMYPGTYHEILFEKDWARGHAMQAAITFLKTGERPSGPCPLVVEPPPEQCQRVPAVAKSLTLSVVAVAGCVAGICAGLAVVYMGSVRPERTRS